MKKLHISLKLAFLILLLTGFFFYPQKVRSATGINTRINFQGKLVNSDGTNVTDGTYNIEFKIYQDGDGVPGGGDETIKWTETRIDANKVSVADGIFRVSLGSVTAFGSNIDFNQDTLWLSINIGGTGTPSWDEEMNPMVRFASAPYALNAEKVAGLSVTNTTGTLTIPNGKTIQFAEAFTTSGAFPLTLTTSASTNVTLPTTGTLVTNTASTVQTITSTQSTGTILGVTDSTGLTGTIKGLVVTLSGGNAFDQTGLEFNLSNASGSNLNDIVGTAGSWKVSKSGALTVTSCSGCGGGGGTLQQAYDAGKNIEEDGSNPILIQESGTGSQDLLQLKDNGAWTGKFINVLDGSGSKFTVENNGDISINQYIRSTQNSVNNLNLYNNGISLESYLSAMFAIDNDNNDTIEAFDLVTNGGQTNLIHVGQDGGEGLNAKPKIGIGSGGTNPSATLQVQGAGTSTGLTFLTTSSIGTSNFSVLDNGNVGIGTAVPGAMLDVNGGNISVSDGQSYTGAGAVTLSSADATTLTINSGTTGAIDIGTGANAKTITIGNTTTTTTININSGTGGINLEAGGTSTSDSIQIGQGGSGGETPDILGLDVKSTSGDTGVTAFEGAMYYNTYDNKFRCYQGADWTDCIGTGASGPWTDATVFTYLTDTAEDLVLGAITVANATFFMDVSAGGLYLGKNEAINGGLTFYSSGVGETDPTIVTNATGDLTLSAPSGKVVVGAGSGNISISMTEEQDVLLADKLVTLTDNYSHSDYTFTRQFTGGSYTQDGALFVISDTSGGAGTINPDMLVVNSALTSGTFTGNLLRLQVNSSDKLSVSSTGLTILGSGSNAFTFDPSSGPTYEGSARPSKTIILSPEYPGASLITDGSSSTNGSMTSDNSGSSNGWRNYYQWSSSQADDQDYTVITRVSLPPDWDSWQTGSCPGSTCALEIWYQTGVAASGNNKIDITVNNDTDQPTTAVCTLSTLANTSWTGTGCTSATLDDGTNGDWDGAGETAVLRLKLTADNTASALSRVGDIILRYKAKY